MRLFSVFQRRIITRIYRYHLETSLYCAIMG